MRNKILLAVAAVLVVAVASTATASAASQVNVYGVTGAVKGAKGGSVEFRVEKAGIVHAGVGKVSFDIKALEENVRAFTDAVTRAKPAGAKGNYIKKVSLTSTMGPGVKLDLASLNAQ